MNSDCNDSCTASVIRYLCHHKEIYYSPENTHSS